MAEPDNSFAMFRFLSMTVTYAPFLNQFSAIRFPTSVAPMMATRG